MLGQWRGTITDTSRRHTEHKRNSPVEQEGAWNQNAGQVKALAAIIHDNKKRAPNFHMQESVYSSTAWNYFWDEQGTEKAQEA